MSRLDPRVALAVLAAALVTASCGGAMRGAAGEVPGAASAQPGRIAHSPADVKFMQGMIPHHAQAVLIAGWAESHGASASLLILCERMIVAQGDEIRWMRNWLLDRGEEAPAADATHARMMHDGVAHDMLMPGMLTPEDLARLDAARGEEFDRLFLTSMIRHHQGAITMIDELFSSYGAAQDDDVFKLASDMYADQTTEIERMQSMLEAYPPGGRTP